LYYAHELWHELLTVISQHRIVGQYCPVLFSSYNSQDVSCNDTALVLIYDCIVSSVTVLQWVVLYDHLLCVEAERFDSFVITWVNILIYQFSGSTKVDHWRSDIRCVKETTTATWIK